MKIYIFWITISILLFSNFIFAQEFTEYEEDYEEEVIAEQPTSHSTIPMRNVLFINTTVNYTLQGLPYYSIGIGFDIKLLDNLLVSTGVSIGNNIISDGDSYTGANDVKGGETNYIDVDLTFRPFITKDYWFAFGFIYEIFTNGYYIDQAANGDILHTVLTNTDVKNKMIAQIGTGFYSAISKEIYIKSGLYAKYNLPTSENYTFSISDFVFAFDLGIGIQIYK